MNSKIKEKLEKLLKDKLFHEKLFRNRLEKEKLENIVKSNVKNKLWLRQNVSGSFSKEMTLCNQLIDKYKMEINDNTKNIEYFENYRTYHDNETLMTVKNNIKKLKDENECYYNCVKQISVMFNEAEKREKIFYITHDDDMSYDVYKDALIISMSS